MASWGKEPEVVLWSTRTSAHTHMCTITYANTCTYTTETDTHRERSVESNWSASVAISDSHTWEHGCMNTCTQPLHTNFGKSENGFKLVLIFHPFYFFKETIELGNSSQSLTTHQCIVTVDWETFSWKNSFIITEPHPQGSSSPQAGYCWCTEGRVDPGDV